MATARRTILWILPLLVLAVLAFLLLTRPQPRGPNILWITIDSLRADHLGCTGYAQARTPNIDALAEAGALFTQCVSQASYTNMSVPSMLTGKYPFFTGVRTIVPDLDSAQVTLAEILSASGYFSCAIPEPWLLGFFQGFERWQQISSDTRQKTRWCLQTLDGLDRRPFFIWLYYWDPHAPYHPPEMFMRAYEADYTAGVSQARLQGPPGLADDDDLKDATGHYSGMVETLVRINQGQIVPSRADREHLVRLYDAEVSFVDSCLGAVLEKIAALGLWDSTLVVINADHGEGFGEHGHYYHGNSLYEEQVRVPLIIKPPHGPAGKRTIAGTVRNIDIMPTILDYCQLRRPQDIQGISLRPAIEAGQTVERPACIETHNLQNQMHLMAFRAEGYKLIYNLTLGEAELYHLDEDPRERHDLLAGQAQAAGDEQSTHPLEIRLKRSLLEALGADRLEDLKVTESITSMDPRTRERLRALGYIY
jgi:arylsulfatase A-like enzyme